MDYNSMTVKNAMRQISRGEIFLPAIQRKFVWGPQKSEALFDSIMRGYPIGTFLFWAVEGDTKNNYTFYTFIQDYHEKDNAVNEVAPKPHLGEKFIGVLDGQQRLNSLYVALQGSRADKKKHGHWNNAASFPKKWLYLDLFYSPPDDDESGVEYRFAFLTRDEAQVVTEGQFWIRVKEVLEWPDLSKVLSVVRERAAEHPEHATKLEALGVPLLTKLWQRLCVDEVISFFSVNDQELDRIVDIFIRVNSTGVPLSKTDLLFSSIVAHWNDGRAEIEEAIKVLNGKGAGFSFDNDFVMRSCLALSDVPVQLKVNSFKKANIERIRELWPRIRSAMEAAVDLLVEWGFSRETLPTQNAVVPLAYFAFKGGDVAGNKGMLRQYLVRALLRQIFRSKTDRVVATIRDNLREQLSDRRGDGLRSPALSLGDLCRMKLPDDRTFKVEAEDIEELLDEKKGSYTFILLSLLYPYLKYEQMQFHQDHIHPYSQFTDAKLRRLGLDSETIRRWQEDRDRLPNLQLMEGGENKSKNDTPFADWIETLDGQKQDFLARNHIPLDASLSIEDFQAFLTARRQMLKAKLSAVLSEE